MIRNSNRYRAIQRVLCFVFLFSYFNVYSQHVIKKIDLYICPFYIMTPRAITPKEVKQNSSIFIEVQHSILKEENDDLYSMIIALNNSDTASIIMDYRIKCVLHKRWCKTEILYFNPFGDFFYKGKVYHNEKIKKFIFEYIPASCKDYK